jgi:hypothetical protein
MSRTIKNIPHCFYENNSCRNQRRNKQHYRQIKTTLPHHIDKELQELGYTPKTKHLSRSIFSWDDLYFSYYSGRGYR